MQIHAQRSAVTSARRLRLIT